MDLLIVGSGFFGLTIAERAAAAGRKVTVIDRRHHIGGNAYSEDEPETGIEVHRYGAHLFHTSNPTVWEYVNRFTTFTNYSTASTRTTRASCSRCRSTSARSTSSSAPAYSPDEAKALIHELAGEFDVKDAANLEEKGIALIGRPALRGVHPRLHRQAVADRSQGPASRGHQPPARALQLRQPLLQRHVGRAAHRRLHRVDRADGGSPEHRGASSASTSSTSRSRSTRRRRSARCPIVYTGPDRSLLRLLRGRTVVADARLRAGGR